MDGTEALRVGRWMLLGVVMGTPAWEQSLSQTMAASVNPAPAKVSVPASVAWRQRSIKFIDEKAVLGLPARGSSLKVQCTSDNTAFFNLSADATTPAVALPDIFGVSTGGEVKHLRRKLPIEFDSVSVRDFFVGEQTLVTLLEAVKGENSNSREVDYFLSVSDSQGDFSNLLPLAIRFKPFKVAVLGSGDFLVMGWDEANLEPMLAVIKDDGTVRHFVDLRNRRPNASRDAQEDSLLEILASEQSKVTQESLQGATFVSFGKQVLLTFPGTSKPLRVLDTMGVVRSIPVILPGGYVMHDVLASDASGMLVLRAQAPAGSDKPTADDSTQDPTLRLFEVSPYGGTLLRELVFDKPRASDVACAAGRSLTAIYLDAVGSTDQVATDVADKPASATNGAMQLVVSTALR